MKLLKKIFIIVNVAFLFLFLLSVTNVNILASKGKGFSNNYNTISDDELKTIANKSEFSDNKIIYCFEEKIFDHR